MRWDIHVPDWWFMLPYYTAKEYLEGVNLDGSRGY